MQIVGNVAGSVLLYLTDYSLQKRSREMAKRALEKKITLPDLAAADLDNDGSIRYTSMLVTLYNLNTFCVAEICLYFFEFYRIYQLPFC